MKGVGGVGKASISKIELIQVRRGIFSERIRVASSTSSSSTRRRRRRRRRRVVSLF